MRICASVLLVMSSSFIHLEGDSPISLYQRKAAIKSCSPGRQSVTKGNRLTMSLIYRPILVLFSFVSFVSFIVPLFYFSQLFMVFYHEILFILFCQFYSVKMCIISTFFLISCLYLQFHFS